jgi:tetratricopeptide (TPR) repeat protein
MNSPLPLKCFFRGRLEFGNERTFEKVKTHFLNRIETMYRSDVLFSLETDFKEEEFAIELTRDTLALPEKSYRKSMDLLKELAQYGLAGRIKGWAIDTGRVIWADTILPNNEKDAVVTFKEALSISTLPGNEIKAIQLLNESLTSFKRNPLAYDRRGFISYKMGKYDDAIVDFEKSIKLFKDNPEPHYGLGRCHQMKEDWTKMKQSMLDAMKSSLPRESIYHTSRMFLGIALTNLGENEAAEKELLAFVQRPYDVEDHNSRKLFLAYKYLGKLALKKNDTHKGAEYFQKAFALAQLYDNSLEKNDFFPTNMIQVVDAMTKPTKKSKGSLLVQTQ